MTKENKVPPVSIQELASSKHQSKIKDQAKLPVVKPILHPPYSQKESNVNGVYQLTPAPKMSIVIAGRNSEKFLDECIRSAISQTLLCEIVYVDDCSTDSSLFIASQYIPQGVRVISNSVHRGVCECRNQGALSTRAPYIIFLDTDDILPNTYAFDMLRDITSKPMIPFVYPSTKTFGAKSVLWKNSPWDSYDKWQHNQISTTSCWSRWAFVASGMWDRSVPTMWDYDLALRCSRHGTPLAGKAILNYRIHDDSQSALLDERVLLTSVPYKELIRRKNAKLGISCLYSGRLGLSFFDRWLDKLATSVRYAQDSGVLSHKPNLLILAHNNWVLPLSSGRYQDTFNSVQLSTINQDISYFDDQERRIKVSKLLARSCAEMQSILSSDICWFVEDDILVPLRACEDMYHTITKGNHPAIAVSATYYSRHMPTQVIGGYIRNNKHFEPHVHFPPEEPVDFCGTGCFMFWSDRPGTPKFWRNLCTIEHTTAHDWAWAEDCDGEILMLGRVTCDHMIDVETPA